MSRDIIVLVVDDERDHADGIAEALQKCCAKAIAVYNGSDALEILRSETGIEHDFAGDAEFHLKPRQPVGMTETA